MKHLLTFYFLLSAFACVAQPSLTTLPSPSHGTTTTEAVFNFGGTSPSAEATGPDHTWNLSSFPLSSEPSFSVTIYTDPENSANGSLFPDADFYLKYESDEYFYQTAGDSLAVLSYYDENTSVITPITDPEVLYKVPFLYGETQSDVVRYSNSSEKILTTTEFDGYGTLKLPMGDFEVVRLKRTLRKDTPTADPFEIHYYWYVPGEFLKVATLIKVYNNGSLVISAFIGRTSALITSNTSSVEKQEVTLYPQPASQNVSFAASEMSGTCYVKVINLKGEQVLETTQAAVNGSLQFNIGQLKSGLYQVEIINQDTHYTSKLVVE